MVSGTQAKAELGTLDGRCHVDPELADVFDGGDVVAGGAEGSQCIGTHDRVCVVGPVPSVAGWCGRDHYDANLLTPGG